MLPRGYEFSVSFLGKLATWILYLSIGLVIATPAGTDWPLVLFWIGVTLAVIAAVSYVVAATEDRPMKAVVMAGGEGTRLRPLTSNQPKPMVPVVGKPCMEHILDLLRGHGFEDVIVTLAFLPQAIKSHFGNGEELEMSIEYSLEESPMGTAGSVRLAATRLDGTFLVISGDALTDFDLGEIVAFHREKGAAATIALKAVPNPLEFGIVVTDEDGRIERFLEKPSWGQVFSDTINTGIYVLEADVLKHVPDDRPYDFSKELFPHLLEMGLPLYGYVCDGYWQDIGNLDQYRQANTDALDERVTLDVPGIRLRGNIWLGEGVEIDDLEGVEGPAFIGSYSSISPEATVGAYSVLGASVRLRESARVVRSVIDSSTFVGRNAIVEGAVVGRSCDIRSHARVHDGVALGDGVIVGRTGGRDARRARLSPQGDRVRRNGARERDLGGRGRDAPVRPRGRLRHRQRRSHARGRGPARRCARHGAPARRPRRREPRRDGGLPDDQARDGLGSQLDRDRRRRPPGAAGAHQSPPPADTGLRRRLPRGCQPDRPRDAPDPLLRASGHPAVRRGSRRRSRSTSRASSCDAWRPSQIGRIGYPVRVREGYAQDLLEVIDRDAIRQRDFRLLVDYGGSAASFVLPLVLGPLGIETVSLHEFAEADADSVTLPESLAQAERLVQTVGADFGAVLDRSAERLFLVDENGKQIAPDHVTLLYVRAARADRCSWPRRVPRHGDRRRRSPHAGITDSRS